MYQKKMPSARRHPKDFPAGSVLLYPNLGSKGSHSNRLSLEIFILYAAASAATVLSCGLSIAASTERGTPAL